MVKFIPVKYQSFNYPDDLQPQPQIQEVTCNLGTDILINPRKFDFLSLHTDPSIVWTKVWNRYPEKKEKMRNSIILPKFPTIFKNFEKYMIDPRGKCISILWSSKQWSKEFAGFLARVTERIKCEKIKVIEVHSPFDQYCNDLETFLERYIIFENEILKIFPSADIVIENQFTHEGKREFGKFLLSRKDDIIKLSRLISDYKSKLRIVLDIPQLFSTYYGNRLLLKSEIVGFLTPLKECRNFIRSTHIWGYDINQKKGAHKADFNTWFGGDQALKHCFIQEVCNLFDDDQKRYFVPEVNDTSKIQSIVIDLIEESKIDKKPCIEFVRPD